MLSSMSIFGFRIWNGSSAKRIFLVFDLGLCNGFLHPLFVFQTMVTTSLVEFCIHQHFFVTLCLVKCEAIQFNLVLFVLHLSHQTIAALYHYIKSRKNGSRVKSLIIPIVRQLLIFWNYQSCLAVMFIHCLARRIGNLFQFVSLNVRDVAMVTITR